VRSKGASSGVATPLRLSGPMHGVTFRTHPAPIPYGVLDCRLAMTLDALAETIAPFGVVGVRVDNMYRKRAHLPGRRSKRSQHAYGLAVDIMSFTFEDGRTIEVEDNWGAAPGTVPCGEAATIEPPSADAELMRNIICTVAQKGLFHHLLTPSYDAAHRNHYHLDIKREGTRISVR
jgi:hypothetical protein